MTLFFLLAKTFKQIFKRFIFFAIERKWNTNHIISVNFSKYFLKREKNQIIQKM